MEKPLELRTIKPDGLSWLAKFAALTGILLVVAGSALVSGLGTSTDGPEGIGMLMSFALGDFPLAYASPSLVWFGGILLGLAMIYFLASFGLFQNRRWAWALSLGLVVLELASNIIQTVLFWPGGLVWVIVALPVTLVILTYLLSSDVRRFFNRDPGEPSALKSSSSPPSRIDNIQRL